MADIIVGIVGLSYVGLPLAITFGQKYQTIGFDIKKEAIENYRQGIDLNNEVDEAGFAAAKHLQFTTEVQDLHLADFIIVAVPTPIDAANQPELRSLIDASRTAGANMEKRCDSHLRVHRVPRCNGRRVRADTRRNLRPEVAAVLFCRLCARTDQHGRQRAYPVDDHQSRFRRYPGNTQGSLGIL